METSVYPPEKPSYVFVEDSLYRIERVVVSASEDGVSLSYIVIDEDEGYRAIIDGEASDVCPFYMDRQSGCIPESIIWIAISYVPQEIRKLTLSSFQDYGIERVIRKDGSYIPIEEYYRTLPDNIYDLRNNR